MVDKLKDKDNFCGLLVEEGAALKESLLKMNEEGRKLEQNLLQRESLTNSPEKYLNSSVNRDNDEILESPLNSESNVMRKRYMELKEESEKLVQVNH